MEEQLSMFHGIAALIVDPSRPAAPHHKNPDQVPKHRLRQPRLLVTDQRFA
jgi:hypothetical protein